MPVKGIRDTEKVAVGAIRTAIQTWLAPELKSIGERLTHVEARLDGLDHRLAGLEQRVVALEQHVGEDIKALRSEMGARFDALRSEFVAHFDAVRAELRRLDTVADFRERLASLGAKFAQQLTRQ
jgi:chromosome segregation ATPase